MVKNLVLGPDIFQDQADPLRRRQRVFLGQVSLAVEQFPDGATDDEFARAENEVLVNPGVVDPDHARVVDLRGGLHVRDEMNEEFAFLEKLGMKNLERDRALRRELPGRPNRAGTALADLFKQSESRKVDLLHTPLSRFRRGAPEIPQRKQTV